MLINRFIFSALTIATFCFIEVPLLADLADDFEDLDEDIQQVPTQKPSDIQNQPPTGKTPKENSKSSQEKTGTKENAKNPENQKSSNGSKSAPKKVIKTKPSNSENEPVKFTSKGLKGSGDGRYLELRDDVVITQGALTLQSDHAEVFVDKITQEVDRVKVKGHVLINKSDPVPENRIKARSNQAVFYSKEQKVILKGKAKLWRGSDVVKGKTIIYDLKTGWIQVDHVEGVMKKGSKNGGKK
jgi:lipopolysaccharide transport protein LptA